MKAKNLLLTLAVGAMAISCNNSGSMTQTSASLKTTADSASFYIGYMYGSGLQQMGFSEVNREALIAGLNSAIAKKEVGKDPREIQMFLNGFMQEVAMKKATENAEKGKKFLEEKIGFLDIYEIIAQSMERHKKIAHPDLDEILSVEQDTYQWIESRW